MSNDHYVPQHFLRAWAIDENKKKFYVYKYIESQKKVTFSKGSIISSASNENLYEISDGKHNVSFEASVMTTLVDTPMSEIVCKIRDLGLSGLNAEEKEVLACYMVILEGRHPDTLDKMSLDEEQITKLANEMRDTATASEQAITEMENLLMKMRPTLGALSAGLFASWGHGREAKALLNKGWIELDRNDKQGFICSNYPLGGHGDFEFSNSFFTLPLSPTKALWMVPVEIKSRFDISEKKVQDEMKKNAVKIIDIFTLAKATQVYSICSQHDHFIERHIGWKRRIPESEWSKYFAAAMNDGAPTYPY